MKWYLDFGHGGKDSGAIGPTNLKESDIVLKIGMMVKEALENAFEKVITTRENDKYYSLDYRAKKANKENCDYFISIHLNAATNPSAKGCEVWLYDENSKFKTLANNLCNNLSTKVNTPNRGVKYSKKLAVLKNTKMPSLLVEVDFISNSEVENNLRNNKYLKDISDTISSTLLGFVNKSIVDDGVFSNGCICSGSKDTIVGDIKCFADTSLKRVNFYRVCIGTFNNKDNAINLKNEAISKGFKDTYIIYN
ncbi:MAG: N-acetylmuramoyl-L-alanine amidase [Clostridium sp.]|nr:N-acetylmuramoyl-L-alanine amidase [Clostridium sp.]